VHEFQIRRIVRIGIPLLDDPSSFAIQRPRKVTGDDETAKVRSDVPYDIPFDERSHSLWNRYRAD